MNESSWKKVELFIKKLEGKIGESIPRKISILHETDSRILPMNVSNPTSPNAPPSFHKVLNCFREKRKKNESALHKITDGLSLYSSSPNAQQTRTIKKVKYSQYLIERPGPNWWYSYFLRTLPCARGRVGQRQGTCWFSTVLNCLLLTESLRSIWEVVPIPITSKGFDYIANSKLLGKNKKETKQQDNEEWGRLVATNKDRANYKATLLNLLHGRLNVQAMPLSESAILQYSKIANTSSGESGNARVGLERILLLLLDDNRISKPELSTSFETHIHINSVDEVLSHLGNATKKIVIFGEVRIGFTESLPLKDNDGKYDLVCGGISSRDHTIAGLFCQGKAYVYDSSNISATTDWHLGLHWNGMGEYYKQLSLMDPQHTQDINSNISNYYEMLMYVRTDAAEGI